MHSEWHEPSGRRRLIVNADDFGRSAGVNEGVIAGYERGIVTSASLMVLWPAAAEAARAAAACPSLSVGLHIDIGEWRYQSGSWTPRYQRVRPDDPSAVHGEVERQLERFRAITRSTPTHLDSHQHVHRSGAARQAIEDIARELDVPLRGKSTTIGYVGAFYGQTARGRPMPDLIGVDALLAILQRLPEGTTELGCHPAARVDFDDSYAEERLVELDTLCDPRVVGAVRRLGIRLRSFGTLASEVHAWDHGSTGPTAGGPP